MRLAQRAKVTSFGMIVHHLLHPLGRNSARGRTRAAATRQPERNVGIEPAARGGDQLDQDWARCLRVLVCQPSGIGLHALAQLGRAGAEIRSAEASGS